MREYRIGRLNDRFVVTWHDPDGKRRRYRLDARTRKEAERAALDVIQRETYQPTGVTIADIWEAYRQDRMGRSIAESMRHQAKAVLGHFGHLRADQLTTDHCRAYIEARRLAGKHDGTIWTELGNLQTALSWAAKPPRKMIAEAPHIERPQKPAPRDRWLSTEEISRLLEATTTHHIRLAILLMLGTAGRVTAILELTWDRVDFEHGTIDLRTSETGPRKGRARVPMNDGLRAALTVARQAALTDHVIEWGGEPVKSIKTGFRKAVRDAGLKNVSPHVLRHTAAVHLVANGAQMSRVSQFLGHSSTAVTERVYARFAPDHLREEAAILDFANLRIRKA